MRKLLLPLLAMLLACPPLPAQIDFAAAARLMPGAKSIRIGSYDRTGGNSDRVNNVPDGESRTIMDVTGAGVITHLWFTLGPTPDQVSRNDVILKIYWDGNKEPSVLSPIGPFFGQGWNESYPFISAPLAAAPVQGRSLTSYFHMPFSKGARIEIENQSGKTITWLYFAIDYTALDKLPENSGRFHAWYNRQITPAAPEGENEWALLGPVGTNTTGAGNYVVADIKGRGQFVGLNYYVQNPTPIWYGEGDEMIFVDGEAMPSIVGTGTEDYFNTGWCPKEVYMHPQFGIARANNDIGWLGRTHCYRFHLTDPIHFERSLKFTLEHGHNNVLTLDLATVAYWYQAESTGVPPIPDKAARELKPLIGAADIHRWRDAWRKQNGNDPRLWGDEKPAEKKP